MLLFCATHEAYDRNLKQLKVVVEIILYLKTAKIKCFNMNNMSVVEIKMGFQAKMD